MAQTNTTDALPVSPKRDLKLSYAELARRYRRTIAIPLMVIVLYFAQFDKRYFIFSYFLIVAGEALRIWAAGHLHKEKILTTGGPYRLFRNPLYLGSFMISLGFYLIMSPWWILLVILVYFGLFYLPVVRHEEQTLRAKFPKEYSAYAKAIPAFFPATRLWPYPTTHFSFEQMMKNKEYNAILGILLVYAYLLLRR